MVYTLGSRGAALHLNYRRWKEEPVNSSPLKKRETTSRFSWTNPLTPDVWGGGENAAPSNAVLSTAVAF